MKFQQVQLEWKEERKFLCPEKFEKTEEERISVGLERWGKVRKKVARIESCYMGQRFQTLTCVRAWHVGEIAKQSMWFKPNCTWGWGDGDEDSRRSVKPHARKSCAIHWTRETSFHQNSLETQCGAGTRLLALNIQDPPPPPALQP